MYQENLDLIFSCLSDPTRRDILRKIAVKEWNVGELAQLYDKKFNTISKHLKVLENASLIMKRKQGKYHYVQLLPYAFKDAIDYLTFYKQFWEEKLDFLQTYLEKDE